MGAFVFRLFDQKGLEPKPSETVLPDHVLETGAEKARITQGLTLLRAFYLDFSGGSLYNKRTK